MFLGVAYVLSNHSQPVRARVAHGPPLSWFYVTNGGGSGSIEPCMTISPLHYELRLDESGCTAQSPAWCNAQAAVGTRPSLGKAVELPEVQPDLLSTKSSHRSKTSGLLPLHHATQTIYPRHLIISMAHDRGESPARSQGPSPELEVLLRPKPPQAATTIPAVARKSASKGILYGRVRLRYSRIHHNA